MVNLSYRWTEDLMTYATYSEGFKSGGFTQRVFPPRDDVPSFDPEFVEVYELGLKWTGFDGRVRINGSAFFTDYDNLQVAVFDGIAPVTQNAASAEIKGLELEILAIPVENLTVEFGVGYLDAEYTEIDPAATEIDLSKGLVNTPETSVNFGLSYKFDLGDIGTLSPRIDWFYKDSYHPKSPDRVSPASQGPLNPSFKFYYKPSQRIGQRGLIKNRCSAQCQRLIGHFGRTYPI